MIILCASITRCVYHRWWWVSIALAACSCAHAIAAERARVAVTLVGLGWAGSARIILPTETRYNVYRYVR